MEEIQNLLTRIDAYILATNAAPSTVSRKLFGNGNRLSEIRSGGTVTIRKLEDAKAALAEMESGAAA